MAKIILDEQYRHDRHVLTNKYQHLLHFVAHTASHIRCTHLKLKPVSKAQSTKEEVLTVTERYLKIPKSHRKESPTLITHEAD